MRVTFDGADLENIDRQRGEALCVTVFSDERPLRSVAGRVDWRLSGELSRLMLKDRFRGDFGEVLLYSAGAKLPMEKLLVFGAGPKSDFTETRLMLLHRTVFETLGSIRTRISSHALPGRLTSFGPERIMETFLDAAMEVDHESFELTILDDPGNQQKMRNVFEKAQRRLRSRE